MRVLVLLIVFFAGCTNLTPEQRERMFLFGQGLHGLGQQQYQQNRADEQAQQQWLQQEQTRQQLWQLQQQQQQQWLEQQQRSQPRQVPGFR